MSIKGSETIENVLTVMRRVGECSARQLVSHPSCHISKASASGVLARMTKHSVAIIIGREGNSYVYRLTGLSPYASCESCGRRVIIWNLKAGQCACCQKRAKGGNQAMLSDFEFLSNPAFSLIKQVFRPLEDL